MDDIDAHKTASTASRGPSATFIARDWPYIAMLALALLGAALTSFMRQMMATYWIVLVPVFCLICVASRWRGVEGGKARWILVRTQALHWGSVLLAMCLVFVADVKAVMSTDVSALMLLTLLALGTLTAGVHTASWRMCFVGFLLGLCVPAIAWLDISTLFVLIVVTVVLAIAVMFLKHDRDAKPA